MNQEFLNKVDLVTQRVEPVIFTVVTKNSEDFNLSIEESTHRCGKDYSNLILESRYLYITRRIEVQAVKLNLSNHKFLKKAIHKMVESSKHMKIVFVVEVGTGLDNLTKLEAT